MSQHLRLSPRDKHKIDRLYLKGFKVAEICAELRHLNLTTRQVSQFLYKRGLTKQRAAIAESKARTAADILECARLEHLERFERIIADQSESLVIDAKQLIDGWPMAKDAAGASSLMRAKSLLLNRTFQAFGIEPSEGREAPQGNMVNFFVGHFGPAVQPEPKPVMPEESDNPQ